MTSFFTSAPSNSSTVSSNISPDALCTRKRLARGTCPGSSGVRRDKAPQSHLDGRSGYRFVGSLLPVWRMSWCTDQWQTTISSGRAFGFPAWFERVRLPELLRYSKRWRDTSSAISRNFTVGRDACTSRTAGVGWWRNRILV